MQETVKQSKNDRINELKSKLDRELAPYQSKESEIFKTGDTIYYYLYAKSIVSNEFFYRVLNLKLVITQIMYIPNENMILIEFRVTR